MSTVTKRGRGRPKGSTKLKPGEGKRAPLSFKTTIEMRKKLDAAAAQSGRSLAQQVEYQLEQSFRTKEDIYNDFGGEHIFRLCRMMADLLIIVERQEMKKS